MLFHFLMDLEGGLIFWHIKNLGTNDENALLQGLTLQIEGVEVAFHVCNRESEA